MRKPWSGSYHRIVAGCSDTSRLRTLPAPITFCQQFLVAKTCARRNFHPYSCARTWRTESSEDASSEDLSRLPDRGAWISPQKRLPFRKISRTSDTFRGIDRWRPCMKHGQRLTEPGNYDCNGSHPRYMSSTPRGFRTRGTIPTHFQGWGEALHLCHFRTRSVGRLFVEGQPRLMRDVGISGAPELDPRRSCP